MVGGDELHRELVGSRGQVTAGDHRLEIRGHVRSRGPINAEMRMALVRLRAAGVVHKLSSRQSHLELEILTGRDDIAAHR